MVAVPTPDIFAKSAALHLSKALAALRCALDNNLKSLYNDLNQIIYEVNDGSF
jgi:hypothetical protein